jgi:hypothetical protein
MSEKKDRKPRRAWRPPTIECREVRPEVTAYAGGSDPWLSR